MNKTTPETYLRRIERLRAKHTANAQAGRWQANGTVRWRIIEARAAYHRLMDRLIKEAK